MTGFAYNMSSSTGGLSNLWCDKCREERLHRGTTCGHCGTVHKAYPVRGLTQFLRNSINLPGSNSVRRKR